MKQVNARKEQVLNQAVVEAGPQEEEVCLWVDVLKLISQLYLAQR